jgi:hypothetical protein
MRLETQAYVKILYINANKFLLNVVLVAWSTYIVVSAPPATEEIGALGREIESRQVVAFKKFYKVPTLKRF